MARASLIIKCMISFIIGLSLPLLTRQRRSDYKRVNYHQDVHDIMQNDLQNILLHLENNDTNNEIVKKYKKFMKYKDQIKLVRLQPSKVVFCSSF